MLPNRIEKVLHLDSVTEWRLESDEMKSRSLERLSQGIIALKTFQVQEELENERQRK